jgi:hypothetical protein
VTTPTLELIYRQDEDDEGYLRALFVSPILSGDFEWFVGYLGQHVLIPFEQQLAVYPLNAADPPTLELYGGDWPGMRLEITPVGMRGQLTLDLQLDEGRARLLRTRVTITYGTVQRLQAGLRQLIDHGRGSFESDLA